jgi:phytoene/squalene synthetase
MSSAALYQRLLDAVSRSFALCIPQLSSPFRDRVALAYLLLRVLDTVEDAPFEDPHRQQRQFARLCELLHRTPRRDEIDVFIKSFPEQLEDHERLLLSHTATLIDDAHALDPAARTLIVGTVERMASGMAAYTSRADRLRLVDVEDVSRYCCFVAGTVGEMLTELWALGHRETPPSPRLAYHFGLFLQKVNILKDQAEDEAVGRFFVPDREQLLASLRGDARGALAYLQALPRDDVGYRTFCAWCLMMGATTIANLDGPKQSRRAATGELLTRTAQIAHDNQALSAQFSELMPPLPLAVPSRRSPKPESLAWFCDALAAPLTAEDLLALGIAADRPMAARGGRQSDAG